MAAVSSVVNALHRWRDKYETFVRPALTGLPTWRVVAVFPLILFIAMLVLVALSLSGTSSGAHWFVLGSGVDPQLIEGIPRTIRSDEWLTQQSLVVSQAQQGFPIVSQAFPGGIDATVLNELPTWDWSTLFRPHTWGYLVLGLDHGLAWHWWLPAFAFMSACYLFMVTMLPRRPLSAALLSVALFFTPFFQWWYGPSTFWPVAWALLAMAGTVWVFRDPRLWVRIVFSALIGYVAVTMAIGLYVPYILPAILIYLLFAIGCLINFVRERSSLRTPLFLRLVPLLAAGIAALSVVGLWIVTRLGTIEAIQSTVYPGQRLQSTGAMLTDDPLLTGFGGGLWSRALMGTNDPTVFGPNPSEAATVILISVFLLPALIGVILQSIVKRRRLDWVVVMSVFGMLVILAFMFVPGWDVIAHALRLDLVPLARFRIAFVIFAPLFIALVVRHIERYPSKANLWTGLSCGVFASVATLVIWMQIKNAQPEILAVSQAWKVFAVLLVIAVVAVFVRHGLVVATGALLVISLGVGLQVNPLYRGAFDLNRTAVGMAVDDVDDVSSGTWVGVGSYEVMAVLVESGVETMSGVQTYPSREMWEAIDPAGQYEQYWNRLAHVRWSFGSGEPVVSLPQRDLLEVAIDPCADFAQEHVQYVLTDEAPPADMSCLTAKETIAQGKLEMRIYEVVAPE